MQVHEYALTCLCFARRKRWVPCNKWSREGWCAWHRMPVVIVSRRGLKFFLLASCLHAINKQKQSKNEHEHKRSRVPTFSGQCVHHDIHVLHCAAHAEFNPFPWYCCCNHFWIARCAPHIVASWHALHQHAIWLDEVHRLLLCNSLLYRLYYPTNTNDTSISDEIVLVENSNNSPLKYVWVFITQKILTYSYKKIHCA